MTQTGLIVMPPDMNLRDAGLLLRAAAVTGAPVIEDGRLVGVVSRNDLLTGLLSIPLDAKQAEFESEIARLQALHPLTMLHPLPCYTPLLSSSRRSHGCRRYSPPTYLLLTARAQ